MSIDSLGTFIDQAPNAPEDAWDYDAVTRLAGLSMPGAIFGDDESIMKGDQYRLWLRWFLEGVASPHVFARDAAAGRLDVFRAAFRRISEIYPTVDELRRKNVADKVAGLIFSEVEKLRRGRERDFASSSTRQSLIRAATTPRCYICGYAFTPEAIDAFLRVKGRDPLRLPGMVDILRPRGLTERDIGIEIEHVVPVAAGGNGQGNLRLACGWCNIHKSSRLSLYEVAHLPPRTAAFQIGPHRLHELPAPFWTVRLLALRGRCQHGSGCPETAQSSELFIAYRDWSGSPNPTNLAVYCQKHDPVAGVRMDYAATVKKLWEDRRR
ncbi:MULTISPECIES: HNH endonuclease [Burkholderia]|uniref:HNH endonuclease n=1 Tax=Burkholderia TaxID=32008 RepID=UPI001009BCEB|nr:MULTISPECIES: HNH endonuclease [Burkholderia]NOK47383.1 hypothetical protein [Burkholderia thailandensis]